MNILELPLSQRQQHIDLSTPCKAWQGSKTKAGYGQVKTGKYRGTTAHRAALIDFLGIERDAVKNADACHLCSNRICVNPKHIYFGTRRENQFCQIAPANFEKGSDRWNARLSEKQVLKICVLLDEGVTQEKIAEMFSITRMYVSQINKGDAWKWLTGRSPNNRKFASCTAVDPEGKTHQVFNIKKFAREQKLSTSCLYEVLKGMQGTHKGWRFYR